MMRSLTGMAAGKAVISGREETLNVERRTSNFQRRREEAVGGRSLKERGRLAHGVAGGRGVSVIAFGYLRLFCERSGARK